ncbi:DNA polymerase III subunit delta' [Mariprofundus micogutta]|uniref:DNA polymerase III subunit delta n=1 Tax=Mariprofundus micogutta TaxID=1921010 RepID=A0A1L8CNA3_9PROT|nr:DNA polymerase III subunit [Mariprofundus micogutta]GAV20402.1 DNA polymerase III subunit delta' [Mariprofundus micogutta]
MKNVIGHQLVEQRFADALQRGNLHHAWLLHGIKGIGKHTLAENLTARLLCDSHSACGTCHACRMLEAGSHPDVYHIGLLEKKRDISIDQVRDLLGFLALSGSESERRVVILDDAERLNNQAANALLKGLEEPSPGSLLLIVCADIEKLPATVRSRCLLQHCAPLDEPGVREVLQLEFADTLGADAVLLDLVVGFADGCPGAVSCLHERNIIDALQLWSRLTENIADADIAKVENWCRSNVASVPHELIIRVLLQPLYPLLQNLKPEAFEAAQLLHKAVRGCMRWPGEVQRQSLRAAPSLLACLLELRSALRNPVIQR